MGSKKYYWLKLNENFFEREEVKVIESMPNGKDYIIFYLKLLLKSIKTEGRLLFRNIMPYTPDMLASITNTDVDTVRVAIDMFLKLGLMEMWDDGTLFMVEVQNMVGSETGWAKKKRIQRQKQDKEGLPEKNERQIEDTKGLSWDSIDDNVQNKGTMSKECPDKKGECPTEIELELEIELEIDKDKEPNTLSPPKFGEDDIQFQLSSLLRKKILENLPSARVPKPNPTGLEKWAIEVDRMLRLDGRTPDEIRKVINFAQNDSFWRSNILSMKKLREKWETLVLQSQRKNGGRKEIDDKIKRIDFSKFAAC